VLVSRRFDDSQISKFLDKDSSMSTPDHVYRKEVVFWKSQRQTMFTVKKSSSGIEEDTRHIYIRTVVSNVSGAILGL
jgi:hypothetical protein